MIRCFFYESKYYGTKARGGGGETLLFSLLLGNIFKFSQQNNFTQTRDLKCDVTTCVGSKIDEYDISRWFGVTANTVCVGNHETIRFSKNRLLKIPVVMYRPITTRRSLSTLTKGRIP